MIQSARAAASASGADPSSDPDAAVLLAVMLGRPVIWGLATGGEDGVYVTNSYDTDIYNYGSITVPAGMSFLSFPIFRAMTFGTFPLTTGI